MPQDREKHRAYMREWRQQQQREQQKQQSHAPIAEPPIADTAPAPVPEDRQTLAPSSPSPSPSPSPSSSSPRRRLREHYSTLRDTGLSDVAAQSQLTTWRQEQQRQAKQQAEQQRHERQEQQLQIRALFFVPEARRRLAALGGYNEADVWPAAVGLARLESRQRQAPRLADPEPKRLAAPIPRPTPEQQAGFVWMGRLRQPGQGRTTLGDGRAAAQEQTTLTVRDLIASLVRRPGLEVAPAAAVEGEAPAGEARTLPVSPIGHPNSLGALMVSEGETGI